MTKPTLTKWTDNDIRKKIIKMFEAEYHKHKEKYLVRVQQTSDPSQVESILTELFEEVEQNVRAQLETLKREIELTAYDA
jgi:predicted transcriptional regulator